MRKAINVIYYINRVEGKKTVILIDEIKALTKIQHFHHRNTQHTRNRRYLSQYDEEHL